MSEQPPKQKQPPRRAPTLAEALAAHAPWKQTDYEAADVISMQRFAAGTANAEEQKRVWRWILLCSGAYDEAYRPGGLEGDRDTVYALGKASVGRQMEKLRKLNPSQLKGGEKHGEHG